MKLRFAIAIALPFLALAVQWALWQWIAPFVWFLFFPTVFFSARIGGLKGGLVSTVMCSAIVWYFFIPPQLSWAVNNPANFFSVGVFLIMGYLFSDTHERLRRAQKAAEEALAESSAANERSKELYQRLLELDELKSQFFANVSHELRTPLTLIMSPLNQRLRMPGLSEAERRENEMMLRNARLLYRHVSDLLDASKLESGQMNIEYAHIDMCSLVRTAASHFESLAQEKGIDYRLEVPARLEAEVDGEKLQRILLNLLSNAFKFTPEGGRIEVHLREQMGEALIEVQDNGPGVPADMRGAVFERFRQVEGGSQRRFGGTGLGLAIVKEFAELHKGRASVVEAPGGGALFEIRVPLHAPVGTPIRSEPRRLDPYFENQFTEDLSARKRAAAPAASPQARSNAPLVLVVEDNADMNAFIADNLRPLYRVACAFDGREGLKQALALQPDLILSDIMMPYLSGEQMVAELRRQPALGNVPIIMLSAKSDDELRIRMLKQGVQEYLSKPFIVEELLARVGKLINERKQNQAELLRYQQIVATSGDCLAFINTDRSLRVANPAYANLFGLTPTELQQRQVADILGAASYDRIAPYLERALAGEAQRFIVELTLTDSEPRIMDADYRPLIQDGEVLGVVVSLRDITEIKRSEASLQASAFALKESQLLAGVGSWIWDLRANTLFWSEETYRIYGRDASLPPATYQEVQQYFVHESWLRLAAAVEKALAVGGAYECDAELLRPDGSKRWITARGQAVLDANGNATRLYGTVHDITERKQAEEQLRISEERLQLALDVTSDGLWDWDIQSGAAYFTPSYYAMTEYCADEVSADFEFFKRTVHPEDLPHVLESLEANMQGLSAISEFDYRLITHSGAIKWMAGNGRVVEFGKDGKPLRMIGTVTDISERKAAESTLQQRTAELAQRNEELERFNRAVVGREIDMLALKERVNALSRELGKEAPYALDFVDVPGANRPVSGDAG